MRSRQAGTARALRAALAGFAVAGVAGCSLGSGSGPRAAIESTWGSFFSQGSSIDEKVSLLQDGDRFRGVLSELANSSLAAQSHAQVSDVSVHGDSADVTFTLERGSTPVVRDRTGRAVLVAGVWKVSDATFCSLVAMGHPTPPECSPGPPTFASAVPTTATAGSAAPSSPAPSSPAPSSPAPSSPAPSAPAPSP